jgi:hypothetical protein
VKRVPVDFRYDCINPEFLKMLAEIGHYASAKYGSWQQYASARLVGDKSPVNHIFEHLRQYQMNEPYDHFEGDVGRHLAAIAYNAMMEWHYLKKFGPLVHPLASKNFLGHVGHISDVRFMVTEDSKSAFRRTRTGRVRPSKPSKRKPSKKK